MAKKRKRDFWDDVDEEIEVPEKKQKRSKSKPQQPADDTADDGRFHPTRCLPLNVIMRLLLFVAAVVIGLSGYICYKYVDDRYDGGIVTSYFQSKSFSEQYNDTVEKVLKIVDAIEKEPDLTETQEKVNALAEGILGTNGNFSFLVQNGEMQTLYASSEDAKDRIESSNHFLRLSSADNAFTVDVGGVPSKGLNKEGWKATLDGLDNVYIIYTSVDNNLESGVFYDSYLDFQELTKWFNIAWIAAIVAAVIFIVLLVFCVMATGMRKGTQEVKLSIFDRIFTEIAAIISFAALVGIAFVLIKFDDRFSEGTYKWVFRGAGAVLFYVILIRSYFSLVRRIKTGRFVSDSLIYRVGHAINKALDHLPKVLKGIIVFLFLVALNGGLVLALLYLRGITINDVPVVFVIVPIVFVIELIAFISCLFGGVPDSEEEAEDENVYMDAEAESEAEALPQDQMSLQDWENVDFSVGVKGIEPEVMPEEDNLSAATQENVLSPTSDKTVMLSQEETDQLRMHFEATDATVPNIFGAAPAAAQTSYEAMSQTQSVDTAAINEVLEEDTCLDFIQLNKDVRKMFRLKLKEKSIGVTLRAPEKPIMLDIDKSNAIKVLSILFDNVEKYAQEGTRVYIEMYVQKGKMVYMMKNTIKADLAGQVSGDMGESLLTAKKIIQAEGGKFITTVDGNTFKAGILLTAVED